MSPKLQNTMQHISDILYFGKRITPQYLTLSQKEREIQNCLLLIPRLKPGATNIHPRWG